jgi:hypothetical protein
MPRSKALGAFEKHPRIQLIWDGATLLFGDMPITCKQMNSLRRLSSLLNSFQARVREGEELLTCVPKPYLGDVTDPWSLMLLSFAGFEFTISYPRKVSNFIKLLPSQWSGVRKSLIRISKKKSMERSRELKVEVSELSLADYMLANIVASA